MSDAALDQAKEEALEEVEAPDVEEEAVEEEAVEIEEEEIPDDHKERSNLGRKIGALLRKTDDLESVISKQQELMKYVIEKDRVDDEDYDEPVTRRELEKVISQPKEEAAQYETDFKKTFHQLADAEALDVVEREDLAQVVLEKYNRQITGNGLIDGATAFNKGLSDLRSGKKVPLKGKKSPGNVTKQKQTHTHKPLKKLDKECEMYLNYISKVDGTEKATKMRKEMQ